MRNIPPEKMQFVITKLRFFYTNFGISSITGKDLLAEA